MITDDAGKQEMIELWSGGEGFLPYNDDGDDLRDRRREQGFHSHQILSPFFYNNDNFFVEICVYSKEKFHICELWDCNQRIFGFYCVGEKEKLECLIKYMEFAKNLVSIERDLKKLCEEE